MSLNLHASIKHGSRSFKMFAGRLEKLGIYTYMDFLLHLPSRYEDYSIESQIASAQPGETVTVKGRVLDVKTQYLRGARIKTIQKATIADDSGMMDLVWFNQPYLVKTIAKNATISASGRVERFGRSVSIQSPIYEIIYNGTTSNIHTARLIPVYPETEGITSKWLRRQIHSILEVYRDSLTEYLPPSLIEKNNFMEFEKALREIHFPKSFKDVQKARERLAFDELFLMQLAALKRRHTWLQNQKTTPLAIHGFDKKMEKLLSSLPFKLTDAQKKAVDEIINDLGKDKPMNRLLQGDVGSGKTVVSTIAMYLTHLNGFQSVLMAPTEILAQQHYKTTSNLLEPLGVKVDLVTGSKKIKTEKRSKNQENESFHILIGTHAVLSEKVKFKKLGLIVIDEQQRFGVEQRGIIRQKGNNPHLLTMTATPIPRTVALTMYGDLDLSYLHEMPHGRKRVKTWLVPPEKRTSAYAWIKKEVQTTKSQAFIVCPFIEVSESMNTVKAAAKEFERLKTEVYPDLKLALLHGKMKGREKDETLQEFRKGKYDILVATPVVEVGIDIPNATIIMIEASERFGLAQLHQLRGRVGRGDKQSYCLLFADSKNPQTLHRLKAMETIYSGAELAELDLRLRGPGNVYGTAQHGVPKLKVATFSDTELIQKAKHEADQLFSVLPKYPRLEEKIQEVTTQEVSPD